MADVETRHVTRAVRFTLDPTPTQERLLRSYCGAARKAHNWALGEVKSNLDTRSVEREQGVPEGKLTPSLSWSSFSLGKQFNRTKDVDVPWWREVPKHCFDSGVNAAATGLENWSKSKRGVRGGRRVGFPRFKQRGKAKMSVTFVELNHQQAWFNPSRHAVRLMLSQATRNELGRPRATQVGWIHTIESTARLSRQVEAGTARIQKVTFSHTGGRWQVSFSVRYEHAHQPTKRPHKYVGGTVGVDPGITHLATLSSPVPGFTDADGHIENPRPLQRRLTKLADLDRRIARCVPGSKNQGKLLCKRARLHASIAAIRKSAQQEVANMLAARFDTVVIEDLNVAGMLHNRSLARSLSDAGIGQLLELVVSECVDRGSDVIVADRWFPSSKTCSGCGAVKAKLSLGDRVFECDICGLILDRDVNAARNLGLLGEIETATRTSPTGAVTRLRRETQNADRSSHKTTPAEAGVAVGVDGRTKQPAFSTTCGNR